MWTRQEKNAGEMTAHVFFYQIQWHLKIHWLEAMCEKIFEFSKIFSPENEALECAFYFFCTNKFTLIPKKYIFQHNKFCNGQVFFEVSS